MVALFKFRLGLLFHFDRRLGRRALEIVGIIDINHVEFSLVEHLASGFTFGACVFKSVATPGHRELLLSSKALQLFAVFDAGRVAGRPEDLILLNLELVNILDVLVQDELLFFAHVVVLISQLDKLLLVYYPFTVELL